jgi:hypothetical protein
MCIATVPRLGVSVVALLMDIQDAIGAGVARFQSTIATAPIIVAQVAIVTFLARLDDTVAAKARSAGDATNPPVDREASGALRIPVRFQAALVVAAVTRYPVAVVTLFAAV